MTEGRMKIQTLNTNNVKWEDAMGASWIRLVTDAGAVMEVTPFRAGFNVRTPEGLISFQPRTANEADIFVVDR